MTMIEKISLAIHEAQQLWMERANEADAMLSQKELDDIAARAALTALLEPDKAMIEAMVNEEPRYDDPWVSGHIYYAAAIQAALASQEA